MAHLLLHLTSVRLLDGDENLHPLAKEALKRRRGLANLGCALVDLPRFPNSSSNLVQGFLGREVEPSPWVERLHHETPMALGLELLRPRNHPRALGPLARLALGLGYFAHAAWDSVLHPLTHKLTSGEGANGTAVKAHRRVEKYQAIFIHPLLTGLELEADNEAWNALDLTAAVDLDRALEAVVEACRGARKESPAAAEWRGWVGGLQQYSRFARGRLARLDGGPLDADAARKQYFVDAHFQDQVLLAQTRAVAWCNRLALAFEPGDVGADELTQLKGAFREVDLDADSDLCSDHALGLEISHQREHIRVFLEAAAAFQAEDHSAMAKGPPPPPPASMPPMDEDGELMDHDEHGITEEGDAPFGAAAPSGFQEMALDGGGEENPDPLRPGGRAPR
jgi:hypothetical protein